MSVPETHLSYVNNLVLDIREELIAGESKVLGTLKG
jgi:hypothetical protein